MEKTRFIINGMHCNSCAILIENNLTGIAGVIKAKVSHESKKAVVIYDETKIDESEILQAIEKTGDYQAETIETANEETESHLPSTIKERNATPTKSITSVGWMFLAIASLILNFYLLTKNSSSSAVKQTIATIQNTAANSQPSAPQASPQQNNPQVQTIQSFNITQQNHIRGNFNAPVTLVEFSDFQCPYCSRVEPTLNKILNDYPDQVRLVYKHFPLSFHQFGQKAAEASECASEQGKFWEYHDKLFADQSNFSVDNFKKWAADLRLNTSQFNSCLDSGKYTSKVQADFQEGSQKGVTGTPATFVNGNLVVGAQPYEIFKQTIDSVLKK